MYRVLVVDDSMLIRHTICRYLEERGFEVEAAADGVTAVEVIAVRPPDLLVTDVQMPGMNGCELVASLKQHPKTAHVPVIVLTGWKSASASELPQGADFIIYKDVDIIEQLDRAVTELTGCTATD